MAGKRKRKDESARPKIHPRNKYCENPPDFGLLSSLYPSFQPYVFYSNDGRPKIDWTDFNATRELTRVLLLHDHNIDWWIPDGQLCPTVPNRSNYIHWIEDLLASDIIIPGAKGEVIRGFDIGTGANCIYPLLGASLLGWKFVGSDITDVAIEWANRNVKSNPHISDLIEIRLVGIGDNTFHEEELEKKEGEVIYEASGSKAFIPELPTDSGMKKVYDCPPVLLGVVQDGETFDFCMCNPPFFETIEQAGLNPKTSCGGTPEEMVCRGGERVFITRIIEDSVKLKQAFRWYTSMVGRKLNLNILVSELWKVGATVVKTTEFVQGRTSRWGLAWSFVPTSKKISSHIIHGNNMSFMLQGLQRQHSAFNVLQSVVAYFASCGASCKLDTASFSTNITMSGDQISATLENGTADVSGTDCFHSELDRSKSSNGYGAQLNDLCFRVLVFQQIPGSLLVKGTLLEKESSNSGLFPLIFRQLEEHLNNTFGTVRTITGDSSSKLGK